jgi:hypothetical protein
LADWNRRFNMTLCNNFELAIQLICQQLSSVGIFVQNKSSAGRF